jgi:phosphoglycolate phosphatase
VNILFDLDGTLTDSYQGITRCIAHALSALGRTSPPQEGLRWCIGPPLRHSFATLLETADEKLVNEALALYRKRFGTVGLFENEVYRHVPETLGALQQKGHTLYVATSKPAVYAQRIIDHFGLRQYFKTVYGSELDGRLGDKKSLIQHILQTESIDISEASMVGDREHDMIGATANGVAAFGVLWGYGTREELVLSGANACFKSPQDLVPVFNGE